MKTSMLLAIMSHLSDAQELLHIGVKEKYIARKHINFVKKLLILYPDTTVEVETTELDKIWREILEESK